MCMNASNELAACSSTPFTGSPVLNQTTEQATSNFHISGTGIGNIFDADTWFNIGGNRILSNRRYRECLCRKINRSRTDIGYSECFHGTLRRRGKYKRVDETRSSGIAQEAVTRLGFETPSLAPMQVCRTQRETGIPLSDTGRGLAIPLGRITPSWERCPVMPIHVGSENSFFGASSGNANTTGNDNSFFGLQGR